MQRCSQSCLPHCTFTCTEECRFASKRDRLPHQTMNRSHRFHFLTVTQLYQCDFTSLLFLHFVDDVELQLVAVPLQLRGVHRLRVGRQGAELAGNFGSQAVRDRCLPRASQRTKKLTRLSRSSRRLPFRLRCSDRCARRRLRSRRPSCPRRSGTRSRSCFDLEFDFDQVAALERREVLQRLRVRTSRPSDRAPGRARRRP